MRRGREKDLQAGWAWGKWRGEWRVPGHVGGKGEAVSGNTTASVAAVERHINPA